MYHNNTFGQHQPFCQETYLCVFIFLFFIFFKGQTNASLESFFLFELLLFEFTFEINISIYSFFKFGHWGYIWTKSNLLSGFNCFYLANICCVSICFANHQCYKLTFFAYWSLIWTFNSANCRVKFSNSLKYILLKYN